MSGSTQEKKAAVLATRPKKARVLAAGLVAAAGLGALVLLGGRGDADGLAVAASAPVDASGSEIVLAASPFDDGKARFFELEAQGVRVRYFAVKGTDGIVHTAYDACDACWSAGKGYKQAGDAMICQNCRRSFAINEIGKQHGGCNPAPLKSAVREGRVVIQASDVRAGRHYFDLPTRGAR